MFEVWQGVPGIMYQSIPSITIPPGNPEALDQTFCPGSRDFTRAGHLT